ncbi:hypothetical protein DUNSADRAFT_8637 [Dunaliella salina]|uniref:RRM domain-containing protein n=1 Tax=Dunaliella salina TaxID=3046 RepID=A0ABQ7H5V3_DUNSA|nr:hypothetical protein DUNSADRAFT_8637 [Dunaliella salina]|eukprot:KAF5842237.1 hypothetical protein DUNSADRAFT_8637 [Dunaliella salina]
MGESKRSHKSRDRSRSRSRDRSSRRRSRTRSPSRSRSPPRRDTGRRRKSLFDVGPTGAPAAPAVGAPALVTPTGVFPAPPQLAAAAPTGFSSALPGPPAMPGFTGGVLNMPGPVPGFPNMTSLPMAHPPSQQATRHARRTYVGGLPPTAVEQSIATFFSSALAAIGGNSAGPGNAVVNVYINKEKNFSFVEPNDYNPAAAAALGPSGPNPNLNLSAIGLGASKSGVDTTSMPTLATASVPTHRIPGHPDAENRIFVGGIPYYLTEEQCRELLGSFGAIKSFELIKDKETGMGKGYGFVVYQDYNVTDIAIAGLHGLKMGERTLTVRRAEPAGSAGAAALPAAPLGVPGALPAATAVPGMAAAPVVGSRIVVLQEAVTPEELTDNEEYKEIIEDMKEECSKHGPLKRVIIPRPTPTVPNPPGLAKCANRIYENPELKRAPIPMMPLGFHLKIVTE